LSDRLTVYTSSDDSALLLSRWIHRNPRLGRQKHPDPEQLEEMEDLLALKAEGADSISLIDFTRVNRASHRHNYYIESSEYFDDFYQRIKGDYPYASRRRHPVKDKNGILYWVLFSDQD
jgi:esterase/lipase superfamily enzyme